MKKNIIIIVLLTVLGIVAFLIISNLSAEDEIAGFSNTATGTNEIVKNSNSIINQEIGCSNEEVVFTSSFVDNDKIVSLGPIGALDGGSHGRSYVQVTEGRQTPVYAPGNVVLEHIVYAIRSGETIGQGEYGLWFRSNCDVTFLLDHLDNISDELKAIAPSEPVVSSAVSGPNLNYKIESGTLIGYTDGTPGARTFDFLLLDNSRPVEYINSERFSWDQNLYSQCPYDYFADELKSEYYNLFPEPNLSDKNCGNPSYDLVGTAAGAWFQGDDMDMLGRWLTFGTYTSYSGLMIRKDASRDFSVRDYNPVLKPEEMQSGDLVCYSYNSSWAYARLNNVDELEVATGQGDCPRSFPESESEIWVR